MAGFRKRINQKDRWTRIWTQQSLEHQRKQDQEGLRNVQDSDSNLKVSHV